MDSTGIYQIFLNCRKLEKILIAGVKKASEEAFPVIKEYYEQNGKQTKIGFLKDSEREAVREKLLKIRETLFSNHKNFDFYKKLRYIDTTKCDFISDDVFHLLLLINPSIECLNYYQEPVRFYNHNYVQKEINYDY